MINTEPTIINKRKAQPTYVQKEINLNQLDLFDINDDIKHKINEIMKGELTFEEVQEVENYINNLDKDQYLKIIQAVFKIADDAGFPLNRSNAKKGKIGVANWLGRTIKNLHFRIAKKTNVIIAEGDSWFEHFFIKDIINHLIEITKHPVYTSAFGGDWIGNYLQEQKYLKALKKHKAKVFLLSGGGNDLVGGCRLKELVHSYDSVDNSISNNDLSLINSYKSKFGVSIAKKIVIGRKYLNKKFWGLLNVFAFQYLLIIRSIENEPILKDIKIITQGYDFAIPSNKKNTFIRKFLGHGTWLHTPLVQKGISSKYIQQSVICAMIYEFNEMLIYISNSKKSVFHIDSRGLAKENDWVDELHLKSKIYKKIALAIEKCINSNDQDRKVYTLKNLALITHKK